MDSFKPVANYFARYLGLIVLGTMTLIGIYVIWSYIYPKYQEIQTIRAEVEGLSKKRDELTTYVAYLRELETTTLPFEEELVNYALPSENDVISLIVTYEGLSKTPDMEVSPFDLSPGLIKSTGQDEEDAVVVVDGVAIDASELNTGTQSRELEFKMEAKTLKPEAAIAFVGELHKARRLFTIKSLLWQNPLEGSASSDEDADKIILSFDLGTHYYQSTPSVAGSAELVNKGRTQGDFIALLSGTTIYDDLILESVEVGKEDLFVMDASVVTPTPRPNPTPVLPEDLIIDESVDLIVDPSPSAGITQPITF